MYITRYPPPANWSRLIIEEIEIDLNIFERRNVEFISRKVKTIKIKYTDN